MYSVLIVEDDPMLAEIHRQFVEGVEGFAVKGIAHDGEAALKLMKTQKFDLVILDVFLPKMDGITLLKTLRTKNYDMDVILVTADKDSETVEEALRFGALDYLVKPFEYSRMEMALRRFEERIMTLDLKHQVVQEELDRIFDSKEDAYQLPKGLHEKTLSRLEQALEPYANQEVTAGQVSEMIGLSKVAVRKYLDYLERINRVRKKVDYGSRGRPSYKYVYIKKL